MRLILIAPEEVYEHEVDPSMEVQDLLALVEAETGWPPAQFTVRTEGGKPMSEGKKTLAEYEVQGETCTVFLEPSGQLQPQPIASSSSSFPHPGVGFPQSHADIEEMRLHALRNPALMAEFQRRDPQLADAIRAGLGPFMEAMARTQSRSAMQSGAAQLKQRQEEALNADPYDVEAQKKIAEAIRMEAVMENWEHAMEHNPEVFGTVTMLYINMEVNGHPVKAFVDSGAQMTIISPDLAEKCGIMRLLDTRYKGLALGVGSANILGRIHSAQVKIGGMYLSCSFSVIEGQGVDMLLGLDMLKRFQCSIDLSSNVLRLQSTEVPFLAEHELPEKARREPSEEMLKGIGVPQPAAEEGLPIGNTPFPGAGQSLGGPSQAKSAPSGPVPEEIPPHSRVKEEDVQTLVGLGAERQQAIALLENAAGNVDYAASMLFGGGVSWP